MLLGIFNCDEWTFTCQTLLYMLDAAAKRQKRCADDDARARPARITHAL